MMRRPPWPEAAKSSPIAFSSVPFVAKAFQETNAEAPLEFWLDPLPFAGENGRVPGFEQDLVSRVNVEGCPILENARRDPGGKRGDDISEIIIVLIG